MDLGHWKLRVRDTFVDLEVRQDVFTVRNALANHFQDLRGWEDWKLDDPYSIKGIVGELAATIGRKLMKDSALVLF